MADEGNGSAAESESGQQQQHEDQHADLDKFEGLGEKGTDAHYRMSDGVLTLESE